ncbi:conserved hypothetical protein [Plasmopara halstedii]|uniref:Ras gtpase-activating protein n=1 Tax=Plasmopara halstedii TaxID=4781 RepID=A0A0N7L619_PLAHL|nr:conserved hypothetical protein [Plasmopara halstedii]CEG43043.1 conserved hypothetical protein [Plasmopara halstedii]|eukprot:XP_024579412.1 conserved hypothetical protein [Plasmopara halstedii]
MPLRSSELHDLRLTVQHSMNRESEMEAHMRPELIKCPELLLTGLELEMRTTLRILHKKGRRFESPWKPFFVGIYANTLFYFTNLGDWPRGIVPLADAEVKAVDRIYRHGDTMSAGDDCGPCWKVTSSSGRVLLFRAPSYDARGEWIRQLCQATGKYQQSMDGKAALALARRLSQPSTFVSALSTSSTVIMESPRHRRRSCTVEDDLEHAELLRDAFRVVEKQQREIEELRERLNEVADRRHNKTHNVGDGGLVSNIKETEVAKVPNTKGKGEQVEKSCAVIQEGDLETILDTAAIEITSFRGSAFSDVLSEDDAPEAENGDNTSDKDEVAARLMREGGRENIQSLSLVDESTETTSMIETEKGIDVSYDATKNETEGSCRFKVLVSSGNSEAASSFFKQATVSIPRSHQAVYVLTPKEELLCADSLSRKLIMEGSDLASPYDVSKKKTSHLKLKKSYSSIGIVESDASADNGSLQQQTMELVEIARNLQSSLRTDCKSLTTSLEASPLSLSILDSRSSFSDVTDFGLNLINSNDSDESILSITQEDLYYDGNDKCDLERLSEFEESDCHFLEASGFLDSIHQVMKDLIKSSQSDSSSQPDQLVISDKIIAEICQGIEADPVKELDDLEKIHRQHDKQLDSSVAGSFNTSSPRKRGLLSHARSARDFFHGDYDAAPQVVLPQASKNFLLLIIEGSMSIVASILQSCGREEKVTLLAPLLRVFGSHNRLSHLIRWAIEIEVASVMNVATLFRSDDYASRLISTYSKAIGSKFIRVALSDPIRQIYKLKIADIELNPHKQESLQDHTQVDANAANLMQTCQGIIDSIIKNAFNIPSSYFHICSHLNSKVISRFDGTKEGIEAEDASMLTRSVIGGFLFLRFVCPAITTPHLYGLAKHLPHPETRRILVLVTKLLFKTATGVKFGDREPEFKVLNPFIEKNSPAIQQLFADLAMSPSHDIDVCFAMDSRKIYSNIPSSQLVNDLEIIRSISEKNFEKIGTKLKESKCSVDVVEEFKTAVLYTTDSFQKNSLSKKLSANMKFFSSFGIKPRNRKESDH